MSGSLIERAARVYDFEAHLRARAPAEAIDLPPEPMFTAEAAPAPAFVPRGEVEAVDRAVLAKNNLLIPGAPVTVLAEEFRLIKRNLLVAARTIDAAKARTILVCSARPGDGKTFCAVNLAISMAAERDRRVLLVDADFAKPGVMERVGLAERRGLLDALADDAVDPESLVVPTDVPQLSLLAAGTRSINDTELAASDRMGAVLARLLAADPQRLVIFDSPPALAASPAAVLSLLVGQVLFVVRADRTSLSEVAGAMQLLGGCPEVKLMLNSVAYTPGLRFGSYYGPDGQEMGQ